MIWVLATSYFLHLVATVVWFGGLLVIMLVAWPHPAITTNVSLADRLSWQRRLIPWVNACLILLLVSGFYQMTNDPNYGGFLIVDGVWAWGMLLKHVAYFLTFGITFYLQFAAYPDLERQMLLVEKAKKRSQVQINDQPVRRVLLFNAICAGAILLLTAIMTAV